MRMTVYNTLTGTSVQLEEFCAKYGIFHHQDIDTSNEYHNILSSLKQYFTFGILLKPIIELH